MGSRVIRRWQDEVLIQVGSLCSKKCSRCYTIIENRKRAVTKKKYKNFNTHNALGATRLSESGDTKMRKNDL